MTIGTSRTNPPVEALREELAVLLRTQPSLADLATLARQAEFTINGASSERSSSTLGLSRLGSGPPRMVVYWSNLTRVFNVTVFESLGPALDTPSSRFSWVRITISAALKIKSVNGEVVCIVTLSPDQGYPIHFQQRVILNLPKLVSGTEIPVRDLLDRFPREAEVILGHIALVISVLFDWEDR